MMAVAIMISTFGCANGLILAGARVYYAMARDGLFFRSIGRLNAARVPSQGLLLQGVWAALLVLARTRLVDPATGAVTYGNLYSDLLDYVVFAVLIFYVLTIYGLFVLRRKRPDANRPYRAFGYPVIPAMYIIVALAIMVILLLYKTQTTWPGLVIVLLGVPVYFLWSRSSGANSFRIDAGSQRPGAAAGNWQKGRHAKPIVHAQAAQRSPRRTSGRTAPAPHPGSRPTLQPRRRSDHRHRHFRFDGSRGARSHRSRADAVVRRLRDHVHFRRPVLRGVRLHGARRGLGLHLCLRHAGRAFRLDHRLGLDSRICRGLGHRGPRLVALLPGFSGVLPYPFARTSSPTRLSITFPKPASWP